MYSSKFLIKFLPFSSGCTHDLLHQWNHVKLCVGFLCFGISHLFFSLLDDPAFHVIPTISIKTYQFVVTPKTTESKETNFYSKSYLKSTTMTVKMRNLEQKLASSQRIYNQPVIREEGRFYFLAQRMLVITKSSFFRWRDLLMRGGTSERGKRIKISTR